MFWRLSLFFIVFPLLELLCLVLFFGTSLIGWFFLGVEIVGTGILGAILVRRQGLRYWIDLNRQLDRGAQPTLALMNGLLVFLAAVLIATPGLIGDLIGLVLLITPVRYLVVSHVLLRFEAYRGRERSSQRQGPEIIDID